MNDFVQGGCWVLLVCGSGNNESCASNDANADLVGCNKGIAIAFNSGVPSIKVCQREGVV